MEKKLDLPYSVIETDVRQFDLFLPGENANGGCVFFVHGGGWSAGSRQQWHGPMEYLCERGFVCTSASYHLLPEHHFPKQFEDVRLAMSFVKQHAGEYGFSPDKMAVAGSSSGGQLAAMLAVVPAENDIGMTDELVMRETQANAAVCFCSIFSLHKDNGYHSQDYIGGAEEEFPERVRQASPIDYVCGKEPPVLMIVGDIDQTTPVAWHEQMRDKLIANNGEAELVIIPGVNHGGFYGAHSPEQQQALAHADKFLRKTFALS